VEQLHNAGVAVAVVANPADIDPIADQLLDDWEIPRIGGRPREALLAAGVDGAAAVVVVPEDDLRSMELALLARRMRPDVRLVVQLDNAAVGRALAEVTGEGSVLDVAALAAPSVVQACLGHRLHTLRLAGQEFVVAELTAGRDGTLRRLYGDLAPLAVAVPEDARGRGAEKSEPDICPGRDCPVEAGDRVTLVGTRRQFAEHGITEVAEARGLRADRVSAVVAGARAAAAARAAEREETGGQAGLFALTRSLIDDAGRTFRATLVGLAVLFVVSVAVLRLSYVKPDGTGMSVLDAVYFTVETIGTIGYGDFSFAEQHPWLRAYAVALMLLGVVLAAVWFAQLTQLLVSGQVERSFRRRRAATMRGHIIVVGLGSVGIAVLRGLRAAGKRVLVLERDASNRNLAKARELGVPVVTGDATDPATLAAVNLGHAAAVAVLTSSDLVNIETGLVVRDQLGERWEQVPVVLRLFDRQLCDTVESGFGFRYVRSTAALAAPWFVGDALGLDVLGTFYVDHLPFMIGRLAVPAGGGLDGLAMGELSARTRVVAIHRAARDGAQRRLEYPPRNNTRFGAGDDAYLVGPYEELLAVLRRDALAPGSMPPETGAAGTGAAGTDVTGADVTARKVPRPKDAIRRRPLGPD
jgi:Trk K+ transport system NAD-binding subunit